MLSVPHPHGKARAAQQLCNQSSNQRSRVLTCVEGVGHRELKLLHLVQRPLCLDALEWCAHVDLHKGPGGGFGLHLATCSVACSLSSSNSSSTWTSAQPGPVCTAHACTLPCRGERLKPATGGGPGHACAHQPSGQALGMRESAICVSFTGAQLIGVWLEIAPTAPMTRRRRSRLECMHACPHLRP